jgi:hypothetical protein
MPAIVLFPRPLLGRETYAIMRKTDMQYWGKRSATLGKNLLQKTLKLIPLLLLHKLLCRMGEQKDYLCPRYPLSEMTKNSYYCVRYFPNISFYIR